MSHPAEKQKLREAYERFLASDDGKTIMADLANACLLAQPVFIPNLEPWQPAYRDGCRSLYRHIMHYAKPKEPPTTILK